MKNIWEIPSVDSQGLMFEACGTNIAMCNGDKILKQKATYVTKYSNDQEGIAKFIIEVIK